MLVKIICKTFVASVGDHWENFKNLMIICDLFEVQFSTSFYNICTKKYQNIYTFKKINIKRKKKYFQNINLPCEEFLDTSFGDNEP